MSRTLGVCRATASGGCSASRAPTVLLFRGSRTVVPGTGKVGTTRSPRWSATGRLDPAALYVEAFHSLGDTARLERHMAPLLKVYHGREAPPLVPATYRMETEADGREDTDVQAFQMEPTPATCARAIRSLDTSILRQVALRDALRAEEVRLLGCAR